MSLDNVELTFDAAICIRVIDAQKAVTMLTSGNANADIVAEIQANIQERAQLDLATIIGKNRLNKKHEATTADKGGAAASDDYEVVADNSDDSGGGFRSAIHDSFMTLFKEEMRNDAGVEARARTAAGPLRKASSHTQRIHSSVSSVGLAECS